MTIQWSRDELTALRQRVQNNAMLKILKATTCVNIRKLCLNKRGKHGGRRLKKDVIKPQGPNMDNLVYPN